MDDSLQEHEEKIRLLLSRQEKRQSQNWRKEAQAKAARAMELLRLGMDQEAFHMALAAASTDPGNFDALETIAWVYFLNGDYTQTLVYLVKCLKLLQLPESDYKVGNCLQLLVLMAALVEVQHQKESELQRMTETLLENLYRLIHDDAHFFSGERAAAGGVMGQLEALRAGEISARQFWYTEKGQTTHRLFREIVQRLARLQQLTPYPEAAIRKVAVQLQEHLRLWQQERLPAERKTHTENGAFYDLSVHWGWFAVLGGGGGTGFSFWLHPHFSWQTRMIEIAVQTVIMGGFLAYLFFQFRLKQEWRSWDQSWETIEQGLNQLAKKA